MSPPRVLSIAAALFGCVLLTRAQPAMETNSTATPGPAVQNRPINRPLGGDGAGARLAPLMDRFAEVLTEEQRASFREAMDDQRQKVREIAEQLRTARKDFLTAELGEHFDEEAVRRTALAAAKLEAEMTVLRAKALSQVKPPLSPEQIEKLKSSPAFAPAEGQGSGPRRRSQVQRDQNDLPMPDRPAK